MLWDQVREMDGRAMRARLRKQGSAGASGDETPDRSYVHLLPGPDPLTAIGVRRRSRIGPTDLIPEAM